MIKQLGTTTATLALATLAAAGPALAAERTFDDAKGDVAHGVDLQSVRLVNAKAVRVVVQHENLVRAPSSGAGMTVFVDTDRTDPGPEYAFSAGLFDGTDYMLVRTEGWNLRRGGTPVECDYQMSLDYAADTTHIRMARACLDRPGKVRIAVRAGGQQPDGDQVRDWLGSRHEWTAWVARG
ncbi:hypothetical protein [Nocardioides mesophilus]|uniref:Uncharacterized protein n=1 Tax=Nocardioides mesophilus TaxID=433659 RepID=A0A7G9RBN6_9ACTN|nr:hypothetical protein [Nocardioides mesophilus]QNN53011.1 hypothetical protein H9L09_00395 [Nocardioides mesophilus]